MSIFEYDEEMHKIMKDKNYRQKLYAAYGI